MRKGLVFGLFALATLGLAGSAFAGLPCAAYTTCERVVDNSVHSCGEADLIWTPNGTADLIVITVTVMDCTQSPIDTCWVQLDYDTLLYDVDPGVTITPAMIICPGGPVFQQQTDANGVANFTITGGGAGAFIFDYTVTVLCADPDMVLTCTENSDTLCAKSFDYNGTGNINFFDTFTFLPQLNAGTGYASDFAMCNDANQVNFFDTFAFLPHLNAGDPCTGAPGFAGTAITIWNCDDQF